MSGSKNAHINLFSYKEAVRLGEKRWQDVGIAVCVKCPAMPPYCHFLLLSATNVPKVFVLPIAFQNVVQPQYLLLTHAQYFYFTIFTVNQ